MAAGDAARSGLLGLGWDPRGTKPPSRTMMGPGGVQEGAAGEGKAGPAYLSGRAMVDCQTARRIGVRPCDQTAAESAPEIG